MAWRIVLLVLVGVGCGRSDVGDSLDAGPIDAMVDDAQPVDADAVDAVDAVTFDAAVPMAPFTLAVSRTGGGTIAATAGANLSCGDVCELTFGAPTAVTLVATPDSQSRFLGWTGACTGLGACDVSVDRLTRVAATFGACPSIDATGGRAIGSPHHDELRSIAYDSAGATIVGGTIDDDALVEKRSATGAVAWSARFAGTGHDTTFAITTLTGDDVIVAGAFENTVQFGALALTAHGFEDVFVARLAAADGTVVWVEQYGGRYHDLAYGLARFANGDIALVGQFAEEVTFGSTILSATYLDGFVARLHSNDGSTVWARRLGSTSVDTMSLDRAQAVAITPSGDVAVSGTVRSPADLGAGELSDFDGTLDAFVAVYAGGTGTPVWARLGGSQGDDHARAIAVDAAGTIYVGGDFGDATAGFGGAVVADHPGPNPWGGGFVAAYTANGSYVWSRAIASSGLDEVDALAVTGTGVVAVGAFGRDGDLGAGSLIPGGETRDGYAASLAADGTITEARRFGGDGDDAAFGVAIAPDGRPTIVGGFEQTIDLCTSATTRSTSAGDRDGFVVHVTAPVTAATTATESLVAPTIAPAPPVIPPGGTCPAPPPFPTSTPVVGAPPTFDQLTVSTLSTSINWSDAILATGDIDGDHDDDVVLAMFDRPGSWGPVRVLRNNAGNFVDDTAATFAGDRIDVDFPRDVDVFDANADGRDDVWFAEHGWDGPPFSGTYYGLIVSTPTGMVDGKYDNVPAEEAFNHDVAHGDIDCDGDLDVLVAGQALLVNDGTGHFSHGEEGRLPDDDDHRVASALWTEFCDLDRDGDLDIVAGSGGHHQFHDVLLLDDGSGRYTRAPESALPVMSIPFGAVLDIACADFDRDGWNDLYLERDGAGGMHRRELWRNRGDGTFEDVSAGAGFPTNEPSHANVHAVDLNHDGWIDLVATGWIGQCSSENGIMLNTGANTFVPVSLGTNTACHGLTPLDRDGDGGIDLWFERYGVGQAPYIYRNTTP